MDVCHKKQLVTQEEAENYSFSDVRGWRWEEVAVTKDDVTAARIADVLEKYGFHDVALDIRGKCVYF